LKWDNQIMTHKPKKPIPSPFLENFSRLESALQPSWLLPLRKAGIASFAKLGFPTLQAAPPRT
jgi:hypothetical protein